MVKLSVLMPVYNEARALRTIVAKVLESPVDAEIELICVDDCSKDGSLEIVNELADKDSRIKVVAQPVNMGKGSAIRAAIDQMTGDFAIIQDADLEYDPNEYPTVLAPLLEGRADAVYGSRFASSEQRRVLFFWHSLGNKLLTLMSNMANDLSLTDMETCYKAVRGDLLKSLRLTSNRFGLEPEITARLARVGARIYEVPISYHGRTYAEGKNIGWRDGVEALWLIFKFRFIDTRHTTDSGHATLESLTGAPSISKWYFEQFQPYLGDSVLDAGCGAGNLTGHLIDADQLTALDIDERHVDLLDKRFGHLENVEVTFGDLEDPVIYANLERTYDSVLCVNVVEHLKHPEVAAEGFAQVLGSGGHAMVLVPAHDWLFTAADRALGHTRRYDRESLASLLENAGFEIVEIREFNRLGVLGWMVNKALRRTTIGKLQVKIFGLLLPLARRVERFGMLPGLTLIAIARAP